MSNVSLIWTDFKYQLFLDKIKEFGCSEDDWEWLRLSSRLLLLWFSSKVSNKQNCRCKWSKKVYRWIWWNKFAHYTLLRWFSVWWSLQTNGNEMLLSQNVGERLAQRRITWGNWEMCFLGAHSDLLCGKPGGQGTHVCALSKLPRHPPQPEGWAPLSKASREKEPDPGRRDGCQRSHDIISIYSRCWSSLWNQTAPWSQLTTSGSGYG